MTRHPGRGARQSAAIRDPASPDKETSMPKIGRQQPHDALRDTMWVGKGMGNWMLIVGLVAVAAIAAWFIH
jgi:hypothetical protein